MTRSSTPGHLTATTPRQLALWRTAHKIRPVLAYDEDAGRTYQVCAVDRIRLYHRGNGYAHDTGVIRDLAALERGEGIRW